MEVPLVRLISYMINSDEFELKFPQLSLAELKRFRVEPSWGISISS
jgi:hypothetical protein